MFDEREMEEETKEEYCVPSSSCNKKSKKRSEKKKGTTSTTTVVYVSQTDLSLHQLASVFPSLFQPHNHHTHDVADALFPAPMLLLKGYCQWYPGQLVGEINSGLWHPLPTQAASVVYQQMLFTKDNSGGDRNSDYHGEENDDASEEGLQQHQQEEERKRVSMKEALWKYLIQTFVVAVVAD